MSIEEQGYTEENTNTNHEKPETEPSFQCHWDDCNQYPTNISELIDHVNQHVDSNLPSKKSCHWRGCDRYGVEQSSKFELISHCRNHTGQDSYFCPVPECDEEFVNIDELTQHINIAHDLISIKESLPTTDEPLENIENLIDQTYKYRTPWWFTNEFINTLNEGTENKLDMEVLYNMKFNLDQYKVGNYRYKKYLNSNNDISLIPPFDLNNSYKTIIKNHQNFTKIHQNKTNNNNNSTNNNNNTKKVKNDDSDDDFENYANDNGNMIGQSDSNSVLQQLSHQSQSYKNYYQQIKPEEEGDAEEEDKLLDDIESLPQINNLPPLQKLYSKLSSKLTTSLKINKIVTTELSKSINLKRKQFIINQILLDANIELGLPPLPSSKPARVTQDRIDRELLEDENFGNFD